MAEGSDSRSEPKQDWVAVVTGLAALLVFAAGVPFYDNWDTRWLSYLLCVPSLCLGCVAVYRLHKVSLRMRSYRSEVQRRAPRAHGQDWTLPIIVRAYPGRTQADASVLFQSDAVMLAGKGYRPLSQSWADGRAGTGRVLMLGLAANSIRPDGTLTVTYQKLEIEDATKVCPRCAETIKAAAVVCRFCGHEYGPASPT
jgi:hypothetical protein